METTKNVFISHYSADDEHIKKLKDLLGGKNYTIRNSSVDSSKPNNANSEEYIKKILRDSISWAGTMIVLIGPKTHTREWVNWEIEYANAQGKRIVGIYINGASDSDVPEAFNLFGDAIVGWNSDRIIDAINGSLDNWENPDGSTRPPSDEMFRTDC